MTATTARVAAGVPAGGQFASHDRAESTATLTADAVEQRIQSAYISRYGEVIIDVEPYMVKINGREVLISSFLGDAADRGGYLIGRGKQVKKDGTVGTRTILLDSGRAPAEVRAAAKALFAEGASQAPTSPAVDVAERINKLGQRYIETSADTLAYLDELLDVAADADGMTLEGLYLAGRPSGQIVMLSDIVRDLALVEKVASGEGFPEGYRIEPRAREVLEKTFAKFRMPANTPLFEKTHRYVCAQFSGAPAS